MTGGHKRTCKMRLAFQGAAAVECEHGYDACPVRDPCTCMYGAPKSPTMEEALAILDAWMAQRRAKEGAQALMRATQEVDLG